jgi:DNA invertase Pin-like site-specific DNA recombinase
MISDRTKASHAVRRQQGKRGGQVPILPASVRERIVSERAAKRTLQSIATGLNDDAVATAKGGTWHASTVAHVLKSVALEAELETNRGESE